MSIFTKLRVGLTLAKEIPEAVLAWEAFLGESAAWVANLPPDASIRLAAERARKETADVIGIIQRLRK